MPYPAGRLRTLKVSDGVCFFCPIEELPPFFQRHIGPPRFGIGFGFPAAYLYVVLHPDDLRQLGLCQFAAVAQGAKVVRRVAEFHVVAVYFVSHIFLTARRQVSVRTAANRASSAGFPSKKIKS